MLSQAEKMVQEFHTKYGFPLDQDIAGLINTPTALLHDMGVSMRQCAKLVEQRAFEERDRGDVRLYRFHLMIEELGEVAEAMSDGNAVETADGLTDLLFVVIGTFVTYGLPISALFAEVHRSNMTKTADVMDHLGKGDGFVPPDIKQVLICDKCNGVPQGSECVGCKEPDR